MASDAPCRVLTSATLFRSITSYQRGVPAGLFHFCCAHETNTTIPPAQVRQTIARQIHRVPEFVAEHGDWHLLKLLPLITVSFPPEAWSRLCFVAAKKNDAVMLQWAIDLGYLHTGDAVMIVSELVRNYVCGDFRALSVVEDQPALLQSIEPDFLTACKLFHCLKDVALIQWLHAHVPQLRWSWSFVVDGAVIQGRLEVLRFVYAHHSTTKWKSAVLTSQSSPTPEFLACVHFLLHDHARRMAGRDMVRVMMEAPVEVLEVISSVERYRSHAQLALREAVKQGNVVALGRFESLGWVSMDEPVDFALLQQAYDSDGILFLLERRLAVVDDALMDLAAEKKWWGIVHYLHDHYSVRCTTRTMDFAVQQGLWHEIKFLHEHRTEGCSQFALAHAASADDLALVKYLLEEVKAECTFRAIVGAATIGSLGIVKYFHSQGVDRWSSDAVFSALYNHHHHVVQYLFNHFRHIFDGSVLGSLLLHDEFEIWETLRGQYPEEAEASIETAMDAAGGRYELPTIRYVVHTLGRVDLAHAAMTNAAHDSNVTWMAAVWRAAGPQSCTMATVRRLLDGLGSARLSESIKFVIDNCIESNAKQQAIQYAREKQNEWLVEQLEEGWVPDSVELHPWLVDDRSPAWLVQQLISRCMDTDPYGRHAPFTWPIEATRRRDCTVLAMALEASRSSATDRELSFEGARAAAVRNGDLPTLQWLLEHVEMPVESILLDEALFYHRYEVALWLASHCREACTALEPETRPRGRYRDCGYDGNLREWLESEGKIVKSFIDIDALPWETHGGEQTK